MRMFLLFGLCVLALAGCKKKDTPAGGGGGGSGGSPAAVQNDLKSINLAFLMYCDGTKGNPNTSPVPASVAAIEKYFADDPKVLQAVKDGTYKVFWSAPATQKIIACEKDAETKGGWVCLRTGEPQKMTAAEIQQDVKK